MTAHGRGGAELRVVLADDQPHVLEAVRDLLESTARIQVVALATTAEQAEAACRAHQPDAVVLDVQMPGDGLRAARRIAQSLPSVRVVMLTGHDVPAVRAAAAEAGAHAFVSKVGAGPGDLITAVLDDPVLGA